MNDSFSIHSSSCPFHTKHLFLFLNTPHFSSAMAPEKTQVTEIKVRIDCNGCVQKIKKALHGVNGIYDLYIDFPQQKLTIIGCADPEKIVKAIKKTRKIATICSRTELTDPPSQPTEPAPEGGAPAPELTNPPPGEAQPAEAAPPAELPNDPPRPENPPSEVKPSPAVPGTTASQPAQPSGTKDAEEVHVIYHHSPGYGNRYDYSHSFHGHSGHVNNYPSGPGFRNEPPQPIYMTHSYNRYKPSPYVTEYEYIQPPAQYTHYGRPEPPQYMHYDRPEPLQYTQYSRPETSQYTQYSRLEPSQFTQYSRPEFSQYKHYSRPEPLQYPHYSRPEYYSEAEPPQYTHYSRPEYYSEDHHNGTGHISTMFSDENPNACRIV